MDECLHPTVSFGCNYLCPKIDAGLAHVSCKRYPGGNFTGNEAQWYPFFNIYEDFGARSRYLRQLKVIANHSSLWDAITYPWLRYLLLATTSSYIYIYHAGRNKYIHWSIMRFPLNWATTYIFGIQRAPRYQRHSKHQRQLQPGHDTSLPFWLSVSSLFTSSYI